MHKYNAEAERAVLGCLLIDNDCYYKVSKSLKHQHFYDTKHQKIYSLISELISAGNPADVVSVFSLARDQGLADEIGGRSSLSALTDALPLTSNVAYYTQLIINDHNHREFRKNCQRLTEALDSEQKVDIQEEIAKLNSNFYAKQETDESFASTASKIQMEILENQGKPVKLKGINTHSVRLNGAIEGLCPEHLIILGARPRMGKSAYALQLAKQAAEDGHKVLFLSCEMSVPQLTRRLLSQFNISKDWFKDNALEEYQMEMIAEAVALIHNLSITPMRYTKGYDELQGTIVEQINQGCDFVIIDYIQKIPNVDANRTEAEHIKRISGLLKNLAVQYQIPILALAQLSRDTVKNKGSKKPKIEDLYGSSGLEADADVVLLLNRPGEYEDSEEDQSYTELTVAKNREGESGFDIEFTFDMPSQIFYEKRD